MNTHAANDVWIRFHRRVIVWLGKVAAEVETKTADVSVDEEHLAACLRDNW